jgi:bacillithiol synthase
MRATGRDPLNLAIRAAPIIGGPLIDDYIQGDSGLLSFFAGDPFDPDAYRAKATATRSRFDDESLRAMAPAVRPLSNGARQRLDAIARGEGFFVTTGQQPGLFGGPLYTVYKTLTAIALARRLEALLDAPVLALFWVASDDHDWEEANHVHLLDTDNVLRRLTLDAGARPPRSMGQRTLGSSAERALDELAQVLPPSEFAPSLLARLRDAYQGGSTVASAFAATLAGLFDGLTLGLVDAQAPAVRLLGAPVIHRELEHAESHEQRMADQTARLEAAGYEAQVPILPGASNVFHEDDAHGRERLLREDGAWVLRASGRRLPDRELRSLLEADPARFSPNVVLRPVVESAVFPTLAYVGGPGEVRYLAQTRVLFEAHGIDMPLVFPRLSVLLVEGKVEKVLERFGLDPASFRRPVPELIAAVVREDVPREVQSALARVRDTVLSGYEALYEAARGVDPTLKGPIFHARNEALRGLGEAEKKIRQHVKLTQQTELEQIEKAAVNLAPLGKPQERVLNVHQYLARYGPGLVAAILERVEESLDPGLAVGASPRRAAAAPTGSSADEK